MSKKYKVISIALLSLISLFPLFSLAQESIGTPNMPLDADSQKIMYREVVVQEANKDDLFNRGISWFNLYYVNPESVLNIRDRVNGNIEGMGRLRLYYTEKDNIRQDAGMVLYSIRIELKDNKYRYTLTDFNLKQASKSPIEKWLNKKDPAYNPRWDDYLYQIDTTMTGLVKSMKKGMEPVVVKKDEW